MLTRWIKTVIARRKILRQLPAIINGLNDEFAKGRTGGVITMRWWIDPAGAELSDEMETAMLETAAEVRENLRDDKGATSKSIAG